MAETHVVDFINSNWNFAIQGHNNDRYTLFPDWPTVVKLIY